MAFVTTRVAEPGFLYLRGLGHQTAVGRLANHDTVLTVRIYDYDVEATTWNTCFFRWSYREGRDGQGLGPADRTG